MNEYRPSPALDYQEFVRAAEADLRAKGWDMLAEEYIVVLPILAVPPGYQHPAPLSDQDKLEALRDKRDILQAQLYQTEERIRFLEDTLKGNDHVD